MLKRIPKSDISIRPFKAYKEWSFISGSSEIAVLEAVEGNYASTITNIITTGSLSGSSFNKHSVFGQLRAQFYNGTEDNPFTRTGHKTKTFTNISAAKERFLSGSAKVISIPKIYVGEGIKKGSVVLNDNNFDYTDDSFGNLQDYRDQLIISSIDVQNETINFTDIEGTVYSASLTDGPGDFDVSAESLHIVFNGQEEEIEIISFDYNSGELVAENIPFLPEAASGIKIGNVFYNQGLVVVTRDSDNKLSDAWELSYKSTQTIYEHEYLLIVSEDEFNVSQNPTAIVEVGKVQEYITGSNGKIYRTTTNPGVKYIRKKSVLENGSILDYRFGSSYSASVSGGFEHYDLSSSVDSTGSFLLPFITTIGLYDDNCDLVAVAKLPQPIKSESEMPVNFIVRFDT